MLRRIALCLALSGAYTLCADNTQNQVVEAFTSIIKQADFNDFKQTFIKYCTEAHFTNQNVSKTRKALLKASKQVKTELEAELASLGAHNKNIKKIAAGIAALALAGWCGVNFAGIIYSFVKHDHFSESLSKCYDTVGKIIPWIPLTPTLISWHTRSANVSKADIKINIWLLLWLGLGTVSLPIPGIIALKQGLNYKAHLEHKITQVGAIVEFLTNYQ